MVNIDGIRNKGELDDKVLVIAVVDIVNEGNEHVQRSKAIICKGMEAILEKVC